MRIYYLIYKYDNDFIQIFNVLFHQVRLKSGARLDTIEVRNLLQNLSMGKELAVDRDFLNIALMDVMRRYGTVKEDLANDSSNSKQPHQHHTDANLQGDEPIAAAQCIANDVCVDVVVQLKLVQARGVGRVDLSSGADLFCVAFVGDWRISESKRELEGNRLFQSQVLRGKNELDWIWNEVYCTDQLQHRRRPIIMLSLIFMHYV
jgi:hypothetical protein